MGEHFSENNYKSRQELKERALKVIQMKLHAIDNL